MKHVAAILGLFLLSHPAFASDTILTVTGPDRAREYDLAALESLTAESFVTSTIWTEGRSTFTGVPLKSLLQDAGITADQITAQAINDYAIDIPVEEITAEYPIIAYRVDGNTMSVRDKGPLWIVYPYDDRPDYRTEVVYSRSIWQLDRISGR